MEVVIILHRIAVVVSFLVVSVKGQMDCPLQCYCYKNQGRLAVLCRSVTFSELPIFPQSTASIRIDAKSKVHSVHRDALSGLRHLDSFTVHTDVSWKVEHGAFDNLAKLKKIIILSYVPNTVPDNVLQGLNLQSLTLKLQNSALPYATICTQIHLTLLNLGSNNIAKLNLPKCLSNLNVLKVLLLQSNILSSLNENDFHVLKNTKLFQLSLSNCRISTVHEETFQPLVHIQRISLEQNKISNLPGNVFRNLRNLTFLTLANNLFTKVPCDIFWQTTSIRQLYLNNMNCISDARICQKFADMPRLDQVYFSNTHMSHVNDTTLLPLKDVTDLQLSVQYFSKGALAAMSKLNSLLLTSGHLNLTGLSNAVIGLSQTDIRSFTVQQTRQIDSLPDELFSPLRSRLLISLTLKTCQVEYVGKDTFSPLTKLEKLDLSSNRITSFQGGTFRQLVKLKILDISKNKITDFMVQLWEMPLSIHKIFLMENRIQQLHPYILQGLGNLTILKLERNNVGKILRDSLISPSLQLLNLAKNDIETIDVRAFANSPVLGDIDLSSNRIVFNLFQKGIFDHVGELTRLDLNGQTCSDSCQKSVIPTMFRSLRKLQYLNLGSCKIAFLPDGTFSSNTNLSQLVLNLNKLSYWNPELFRSLGGLTELYLSKNQITTVKKSSFKYLVSLRTLNLANNPLYCNCDLLWFRDWLPQANVYIPSIYSNLYKCEGPAKYRDVQLLDFNLPESECRSYTFLKLSVTFAAAVLLVVTTAGIMYRLFRIMIICLSLFIINYW